MADSRATMEVITYGWLACCAVAPMVAALSVWALFIFNSYRGRWRNVDIFLLVVVAQQILSAFAIFAFAVVNVIRSRNENSCNFVVWGLTAMRVFQLTTLASLAIDRFLALKWPYKYRFSVRPNQIKYHVVVLGVIASLVGVAGMFARSSPSQLRERLAAEAMESGGSDGAGSLVYCSLHPRAWDMRFNMCLIALFGSLLGATLLCAIFTEMRRIFTSGSPRMRPHSRISSLGDLVADPLSSTEALAKSTTGSYRSLYGLHNSLQAANQETIRKKVFGEKFRSVDLRWAAVLGTTGLCYAVNHGPSLVFMVLGIFVPRFWNPLHDSLVVWFALLEGLLLPISLYITDPFFREAVKQSFRRRSAKYAADSKGNEHAFSGFSFNEFVIIDKPFGASIGSLARDRESRAALKSSKSGLAGLGLEKRRSLATLQEEFNDYEVAALPLPRKSTLLLPRNNSQLRYMIPTIYGLEKALAANCASAQGKRAAIPNQEMAHHHQHHHQNPIANQMQHLKLQHQLSAGALQKNNACPFDGSCENVNACRKHPQVQQHLQQQQQHGQHQQHAQQQLHHQLQPTRLDQNPFFWSADKKAHLQMSTEHIYASLSDAFVSQSPEPTKEPHFSDVMHNFESIDSQDTLADCAQSDTFSLGAFSFTTSANDDFEFHDTRGKDSSSIEKELHSPHDFNEGNDDTSIDSSLPMSEFSTTSSDSESGSEMSFSKKLRDQCLESETKGSPRHRSERVFATKEQMLLHKRNFFSASDLHQLDYGNQRLKRSSECGSLTDIFKERSRDTKTQNKCHDRSGSDAHILATLYEKASNEKRRANNDEAILNFFSKQRHSEKSASRDSLYSQGSMGQSVGPHQNADNNSAIRSKLLDAFRKQNIRNSVALRRKALQKKTKKPRFKKNKKSRPDGEQRCPSRQSTQAVVSSVIPSSRTTKSGLSNINRIGRVGSYAQDWHRSDLLLAATSNSTSNLISRHDPFRNVH